jgi:hypothetical protein
VGYFEAPKSRHVRLSRGTARFASLTFGLQDREVEAVRTSDGSDKALGYRHDMDGVQGAIRRRSENVPVGVDMLLAVRALDM